MAMYFDAIKKIFYDLGMSVLSVKEVKTFSNYLVSVRADTGNYFMKIYTSPAEARTGHKLSYLYPLLAKHDVPMPKVITYDDSLTHIEYPYVIVTKAEGEMIGSVIKDMSEDEKRLFYYDFGRITAKIHSITFDTFGETCDGEKVKGYSEANNVGPFKTWKDMHKEIINYRLRFFKNSAFEDLVQPIASWFDENSSLIDYDITPRLLHIDLNQKNIFVKNNTVSGIIDLDGAFIGHNEEELMRIEGAHFADNEDIKKSFFKGYTEKIPLDSGYEQRRRYYYFSRLLVHVGCIIQFGDNYVSAREESARVREEISKLLRNEPVDFTRNK